MTKQIKEVTVYDAITQHGRADDRARNILQTVLDLCVANKITPAMFKNPGKDGDPLHIQHFERTNAAIVAAFSKEDQRTYATPTKSLEEGNERGQKGDAKYPAPGTKRYIQQQVGSRRAAFEKALKKRLDGPVSLGANARTDDVTFCNERLVAIHKRLEKSEDANFDIIKAMTLVTELSKVINTKLD